MTGTDTMPARGRRISAPRRACRFWHRDSTNRRCAFIPPGSLEQIASIPLPGAFGRPLWIDGNHVLIAGANADALLDVDVERQSIVTIPLPPHSYPTQVAVAHGSLYAAAGSEGDYSVRVGSLDDAARGQAGENRRLRGRTCVRYYRRPERCSLLTVPPGFVVAINTRTLTTHRIATELHPSALLIAGNARCTSPRPMPTASPFSTQRPASFANGSSSAIAAPATAPMGVSPNALSTDGTHVFVSLGAANSVAVLRDERLVGRVAAGLVLQPTPLRSAPSST